MKHLDLLKQFDEYDEDVKNRVLPLVDKFFKEVSEISSFSPFIDKFIREKKIFAGDIREGTIIQPNVIDVDYVMALPPPFEVRNFKVQKAPLGPPDLFVLQYCGGGKEQQPKVRGKYTMRKFRFSTDEPAAAASADNDESSWYWVSGDECQTDVCVSDFENYLDPENCLIVGDIREKIYRDLSYVVQYMNSKHVELYSITKLSSKFQLTMHLPESYKKVFRINLHPQMKIISDEDCKKIPDLNHFRVQCLKTLFGGSWYPCFSVVVPSKLLNGFTSGDLVTKLTFTFPEEKYLGYTRHGICLMKYMSHLRGWGERYGLRSAHIKEVATICLNTELLPCDPWFAFINLAKSLIEELKYGDSVYSYFFNGYNLLKEVLRVRLQLTRDIEYIINEIDQNNMPTIAIAGENNSIGEVQAQASGASAKESEGSSAGRKDDTTRQKVKYCAVQERRGVGEGGKRDGRDAKTQPADHCAEVETVSSENADNRAALKTLNAAGSSPHVQQPELNGRIRKRSVSNENKENIAQRDEQE